MKTEEKGSTKEKVDSMQKKYDVSHNLFYSDVFLMYIV